MNPLTQASQPSLSKPNEQPYLDQYIQTLNEKELKAYNIAREHLGMSFQLEKSIGYLEWKKENVPP